MGQRIRYPDRHAQFKHAALLVHKGEVTKIPIKCEAVHRFRLNARVGDRCFCGAVRKAEQS